MPSFPTVSLPQLYKSVWNNWKKKKPNHKPQVKPEFLKKPMNFYFLFCFQYKEDSFEVRSLLIQCED